MQLDPSILSHADNYKLLTNLVVPRPIAWVSTQSTDGVVNLAPFSFFNVVGSNPPYIIISISENEGQPKDTARNILDSGAFVVNLVTEDLFDAMNISAADFPSEQSELEAGKLHTAPSVQIKAPRVAEAQASLECKLFSVQPLPANKPESHQPYT
jgi:flavin reductase (DIM6/NTAB) family NADH-FMN oxidoreductase RutF